MITVTGLSGSATYNHIISVPLRREPDAPCSDARRFYQLLNNDDYLKTLLDRVIMGTQTLVAVTVSGQAVFNENVTVAGIFSTAGQTVLGNAASDLVAINGHLSCAHECPPTLFVGDADHTATTLPYRNYCFTPNSARSLNLNLAEAPQIYRMLTVFNRSSTVAVTVYVSGVSVATVGGTVAPVRVDLQFNGSAWVVLS